ncbi:hypothetical protein GQ457_08G021880 [Hibiscus cannabinus]
MRDSVTLSRPPQNHRTSTGDKLYPNLPKLASDAGLLHPTRNEDRFQPANLVRKHTINGSHYLAKRQVKVVERSEPPVPKLQITKMDMGVLLVFTEDAMGGNQTKEKPRYAKGQKHGLDKKRKICDEEEKMEKFYALINSIREARDRFIINNNKKKRKLEEGNGGVAAMRLAKAEESGNVLKEEEVKECLDLTLSL